MTGKGSIVHQVNKIILDAVASGVSDIHVESFEHSFRIRFRRDGILQLSQDLAISQKDSFISRIKIMADLDIAEKRRPQDGRIRLPQNGRNIDIRVSTLPTIFGEKVVMRILDKSALNLELSSIGLNSSELKLLKSGVAAPYGMVLVSGPTGSGKTTTLYSALNFLNSQEVNITTIEDPIEYHLAGINQTQVRSDIGLTFAGALRSILRQDPNIVMVGEIRDTETAKIAIRASLTGHMVLSTIHTNDAPSTVVRLIDMGVEPYLVSSSLRLIVAQRLVRCICDSCREPYSPDSDILNRLGMNLSDGPYYKGKGCKICCDTGYKGRTAIFELMRIDEEISELINGKIVVSEFRKLLKNNKYQTLRQAGVRKILAGITTPEEVVRESIT